MHIAMLGRQPKLGVAELERIYGADAVTPLRDADAALLDVDVDASDLQRLGGSVKLAKVLTTLDTTDWRVVEKYLAKTIPEHLKYVPEGKFRLGLSVYGMDMPADMINATNLRLKKVIKATGRSVRVVPNKSSFLNSAQVIHNQLTGPVGMELILVRRGRQLILAQAVAEQDIDAYAARDQARPYRDAFVGMLPPKLAQIMINLARPAENTTVLDPFCGTGVVLQEALLMGYSAYGTDLSEKMVDYSKKNLDWLSEVYHLSSNVRLEQADAMDAKWYQPLGAVVCETYLGQPFSAPPSPAKLEQVRGNCDHIISEFLKNLSGQIESGTPLCLAVPAWQDRDGRFTHLTIIKKLDGLGYKQLALKHVDAKDLLYYRPDQVVARELLILEKL
jgi:tRNA (guanine10-N2)-dimethyltransferase